MAAYLDYQSSKPVDPRVIDAMLPHLTTSFGNPSSLHTTGEEALKALEESREAIAGFIMAIPKTSSSPPVRLNPTIWR